MAKSTILVIDDEKDFVELVKYNLEKEGFSVKGVLDGESGVTSALRDLPDLAIVDLMLPGMDGLEVCRRLRSDDRTAADPDHHADRQIGRIRPRCRTGTRGGRLRHQTIQPARTGGESQGRAAPQFSASCCSPGDPAPRIDHRHDPAAK